MRGKHSAVQLKSEYGLLSAQSQCESDNGKVRGLSQNLDLIHWA